MNSSRIDQEAAAWVVAHDRGLTAAEQDAFSDWLAQDPQHRQAFQTYGRMWSDFGLLEEWRPQHSAEPNPDILDSSLLRRLRRHRRWVMRGTALAACLAFVAGGAWLLSGSRGGVDAEATAQALADLDGTGNALAPELAHVSSESTRYVALPDDSEIDLNAGTELDIRYSDRVRLVEVLQGEAFFTVAKDPARPFEVLVRGTTVRAVGTQFGVKLEEDRVAVVVSEGQVIFGESQAVERAVPDGDLAGAVSLKRGTYSSLQLELKHALPEVRELAQLEAVQLLSWKPAVLEFSGAPLAEVVAEFNRHNTLQIAIADDSIRELPLVASFRANNVQGFVNLLEVTGVAQVRHAAPDRIELSAPGR